MKKILSLVLAMLMIFSMVPAVFAAETSESDYQAAIEYLKAIELYKGTTDGDAADELVERYQMALFTARMVTGRVDKAYWETDANDSGFTDIDTLNAEALGGVCYAAQQGIVNGIGGSEFAPFDNVTYRDAIVMIVRALGFNYPASGYPWSYINKARELGVLDGITGVSYTAEVKREVIAQLLYNAINAEIKGETIAASVFGVEETLVMVIATTDGIVYKKDGTAAIKANTVRVSAVDAAGEPIGAEYYVPYAALGLSNTTAANAAVGTYFKLTHKGNFSQFLACESMTQVFENTTEKKEVKYNSSNYNLTLGKDTYLVLSAGSNYSSLNNNQGTNTGAKEIKAFKAWGADNSAVIGNTGYYLGTDGKVYSYANPFVPYAIYSDIASTWFKVTVNDHGAFLYTAMTDPEVEAMLATAGGTVKGFSEIGRSAALYTRMSMDYGVDYDYYKAFATDTDGDGEFERVTVRAYNMYLFQKGTRKGLASNNKETDIDTFTLTKFTGNGLTQSMDNTEVVATWDAEYSYDYNTTAHPTYDFFRFTGIAYNKLPSKGIIVAYLADGVGSEQELEVVDVADKMSAYIRGYDQASDSLIYGSDYATIKLGYMGVAGTSIYRATQCHPDYIGSWKVNSANYTRQFWNKYVDMYVLNDSVVYIDANNDADDYVILESYTGFSEAGLTAVAYSTKAGGKTEILINELNGWQLGGFDYALYEEMLRLQALLPNLGIVAPTLPVRLNTIYAVRYVNEAGAYNLIDPLTVKENQEIYINNYGYIIGVNKNGEFAPGNRVATSDKDLWFILAEDEDKVYSFQGKLAALHLTGADFYKAKGNQFVLTVDNASQLGAILGNSMEGVEYYLYNTAIDNAYRNENIFGTYYYGHAMQNMRTGKVDFITYDPVLAATLNAEGKFKEGKYIEIANGTIYQAVSGALKTVVPYGVADVASLEFAKGTYVANSFGKAAVGAVIPAGVDLTLIPGEVDAAFVSYEALRDEVTAILYAGVYNSDFDKGGVSYEDAIRLELAHKITFINLKADGTRETWNAAKDGKYTSGKVLGTDTHAVYAYGMYDFANAKATIFVDTKGAVELTSNKTATKTGIMTGVDATITYDSNVMKNETLVTVKFSKPADVSAVTVAGSTPANLWIGANSVTFTVPQAGFEATDDIAVTGTALALTTKVTGLSLDGSFTVTGDVATDGMAGMKLNGNCSNASSVLFDGVYTATAAPNAWKLDTYVMQIEAFEKKIAADFSAKVDNPRELVGGNKVSYLVHTDKALTDGYWGVAFVKLAAAEDIKSFRLVVATDYTGAGSIATSQLMQGFEILVSTNNGASWTVAGSVTDAVNKGEWTVVAATETAPGYAYIDVPAVATGVTHVAYAITQVSNHPTDANNRIFTMAAEIELYK